MRLVDLEPEFVRFVKPGHHQRIESLTEADGVLFFCPKCFTANSGGTGTHMVLVWFRDHGVPHDEFPGPGRWVVAGSGYEDMTLSPSIHLAGPGCGWHGHVQAGEVTLG